MFAHHNVYTCFYCIKLIKNKTTIFFPGHKSRVLNLSMSPDQTMVASAAADETIRIWKCFAVDKTKKEVKKVGMVKSDNTLLKGSLTIR